MISEMSLKNVLTRLSIGRKIRDGLRIPTSEFFNKSNFPLSILLVDLSTNDVKAQRMNEGERRRVKIRQTNNEHQHVKKSSLLARLIFFFSNGKTNKYCKRKDFGKSNFQLLQLKDSSRVRSENHLKALLKSTKN